MPASFPLPSPQAVDLNELAKGFNATEVQEWLNSTEVAAAIDRSRREMENASKAMQSYSGSNDSAGPWTIVGALLGVLVVVAIVAFAVLRWRRKAQATSSHEMTESPLDSATVSTAPYTESVAAVTVKDRKEYRGNERPILVTHASGSTVSSSASTVMTEPSAPTATASFFHAVNAHQPYQQPQQQQPSSGGSSAPSAPTADTALRLHLVNGAGATVPLWEDPLIVLSRLPFDAVTVTTLISRGAYGEVFDGVCFGQRVAVKRLSPLRRKNLDDVQALLEEVKLQASLEHARIVKFIGVTWDTLSNLSVVTEFMAGGDLREALTQWRDDDHRACGWDAQKHTIARHVAEALVYLHSLSPAVLHRDPQVA
ncbi:hypothetical protein PINS_up015343 [Pythium insidiosum]|nr:hypothetical protein PINS_up015343 [Pythium insidiosum]